MMMVQNLNFGPAPPLSQNTFWLALANTAITFHFFPQQEINDHDRQSSKTTHFGNRFRCRILAQQDRRRIAGDDLHEAENDDGDAEKKRQQQNDPFGRIGQHRAAVVYQMKYNGEHTAQNERGKNEIDDASELYLCVAACFILSLDRFSIGNGLRP